MYDSFALVSFFVCSFFSPEVDHFLWARFCSLVVRQIVRRWQLDASTDGYRSAPAYGVRLSFHVVCFSLTSNPSSVLFDSVPLEILTVSLLLLLHYQHCKPNISVCVNILLYAWMWEKFVGEWMDDWTNEQLIDWLIDCICMSRE